MVILTHELSESLGLLDNMERINLLRNLGFLIELLLDRHLLIYLHLLRLFSFLDSRKAFPLLALVVLLNWLLLLEHAVSRLLLLLLLSRLLLGLGLSAGESVDEIIKSTHQIVRTLRDRLGNILSDILEEISEPVHISSVAGSESSSLVVVSVLLIS